MNDRSVIQIVVSLFLLLMSCSSPPRLKIESDLKFSEYITPKQFSHIRGGGDIALAVNGEKYNGSADVKWNSNGVFRADFYSPFGTLVASVNADSISGTVFLDNKEYNFRLEETMDSLPFSWGNQITFRQFGFILTGQIPENLINIDSKPDTIISRGRKASAAWKNGRFEIELRVNRKTSLPDRFSINFPGEEHWNMQFGSFKGGLARSIEVKEDDRNYFSIRYERLRSE